jgi:predicted ATPase/DNA-binding winged helix-turn-helix (wHTH) protein
MIQIGRLELDLQARELRLGGLPARIGSRAFDILEILIRANGALVSKEEIFRTVWPDTIVEENNLQVHMSALRKTLGDDRDLIITVPGRGYRFVGLDIPGGVLVNTVRAEDDADAPGTRARHNLPLHSSTLFGRQRTIEEASGLLAHAPVVTLAGAGGIGKTRLGIEVARRQLSRFPDGVWLVELASVTDPHLVPQAIAEACGLKFLSGPSTPERIADALNGLHVLLLLDNCEHLIDTVAYAVETLIQRNSRLRALVTSREPLRIAGEQQYLVAPLEVPPPGAEVGAVLGYAAVQLFLSRARAIEPRLTTEAKTVECIGEICRRLDGIPLPIELAASRAATLGIGSLLHRLDDRLNLLTGGHRTALPRHQTLRATFDWSYAMLEPNCQAVFRRLAVFTGSFTLDAACAVARGHGADAACITDHISELVEKSLLTRGADSALTRFRLLESTRSYAFDKLDHEGERHCTSAAHAAYLLGRLETMQAARAPARSGSNGALPDELDDVRAALDWAFSGHGDLDLGIALSALAVPMMLDLGLLEECRERTSRALSAWEASAQTRAPPLHEASLRTLEAICARFPQDSSYPDVCVAHELMDTLTPSASPANTGKLILFGRH